MKQVLRKFQSRTVVGNTEAITNERIEKELLTKEELYEIQTVLLDGNPEDEFYTYGIITDWDGDMVGIGLDALTEGLTSFLEKDKDDDGEYEHPLLVEILKKIEPYRVYDLDFETEKQEATC